MSNQLHVSVLLDEIIDLLEPAISASEAPVFVDGTLGMGGHTEALLERFGSLTAIGIDRDHEALDNARDRLAVFGTRVKYVHSVHTDIAHVVRAAGYDAVDAILFDLGVSSLQLDRADRGFSYAQDAPLDMRMNADDQLTAAQILNEYSAKDLARVLREYGEEPMARRIADAVVEQRNTQPFERSQELVDLLDRVIPAPARRRGGHPAKRTFQALRIEVNDELGGWERTVPEALDLLKVGGRLAVLSFHSLEDRITKRAFAKATSSTAPRDLPVLPAEHAAKFRLVTRGAVQASDEEIHRNRRAASVRCRAVERVAA